MRLALLSLALFGMTAASAQGWTVQTAAFEREQDAAEYATTLQGLGYDAYTESGTSGGGYIARVRIGCFTSRAGAKAYAEHVAGRISTEVAVALLETASTPSVCLRRTVGFVPPDRWGVAADTPQGITFSVTVGAQEGFVSFDGSWQVQQSRSDFTASTSNLESVALTSANLFSETSESGLNVVTVRRAGRNLVVTPGQLLWQRGAAAVVLEAAGVVAYHVMDGTK